MRIQFITSNLACGGAINGEGAFKSTLNHGVTHIINLDKVCHGVDKIETMHYEIKDDGKKRPDRLILCCLFFALEVLRDPKNKLLVHCAAGKNRSASVCYAILRCQGASPQEAEETMGEKYFKPLEKRDKNFRRPKAIKYKEDVERVLSHYPFLKARRHTK
jgi:hypothetical protein